MHEKNRFGEEGRGGAGKKISKNKKESGREIMSREKIAGRLGLH